MELLRKVKQVEIEAFAESPALNCLLVEGFNSTFGIQKISFSFISASNGALNRWQAGVTLAIEGWRRAPDGVWPDSQGSAEVSRVTAGLQDHVGGRSHRMRDDVTRECSL